MWMRAISQFFQGLMQRKILPQNGGKKKASPPPLTDIIASSPDGKLNRKTYTAKRIQEKEKPYDR